MPSYKSVDYYCDFCDLKSDRLIERDKVDEPQFCDTCEHQLSKTISAINVPRATYVDGQRKFKNLKEKHQLRKEKAAARQSLDIKSEKKINKEMSKLNK